MKSGKIMVLTALALGLSQAAMAAESNKLLAEDWVEWTAVSPGIMERVTDKGELVRAYQGTEGIAAILLEKQRDLRMAEADGDLETVDSLAKLVADLEMMYEKSSSVIKGQQAEGAKLSAEQTIELWPHIPPVCGFSNDAYSTFRTYPYVMWDTPKVSATSNRFGVGTGIAPLPPPPLGTFRSVFVRMKTIGSSTTYSAYKSSADRHEVISVQREEYGLNNCHMETVHAYQATCNTLGGGHSESTVITTEQTCQNLRNGVAPVIRIGGS